MFTPSSLSIALLMMITSAVCWGSWANTYKGVKGYRFELFYWDYAVGIFLVSVVLAFTMGSTGNNSSSFLNNVHAADSSNIINALIGGALFNLANLLLVAAIDMAGLAVAFPISIGIALVVGTVLSYVLQPRGKRRFPGTRRRVRIHCGSFGRQGLWEPRGCRTRRLEEESDHMRGLRSTDGIVGSVHDACDDPRQHVGAL